MAIYSSKVKHIQDEIKKYDRIEKYRFYKKDTPEIDMASVPWKELDEGLAWKDVKMVVVKDLITTCGIDAVIQTRWYTRGKDYPQLITEEKYNEYPSNTPNAGKRRYNKLITLENDESYYLAIFAGSAELIRKIITLADDLGFVVEFECNQKFAEIEQLIIGSFCVSKDVIWEVPEEQICAGKYVIDALESAIWCLIDTDSLKDCLLKAVNLGDDSDTVGAIAGGLAGLYYGHDAIPCEWLAEIKRLEWIKELLNCDTIIHMQDA